MFEAFFSKKVALTFLVCYLFVLWVHLTFTALDNIGVKLPCNKKVQLSNVFDNYVFLISSDTVNSNYSP